MDNQQSNPQQALVDRLKQATNILVTVSSNPSVDELAACLGLTLWLNKIDKHATAVFSGEVPSTLEFLQPEATLEKNTDSLRDFIIALDKSKADKLRYKVEDSVVKIFITPYRTSLSADDLEYSQGDFNVDMVIALGVASQQDLDTAITAHGRILHDATVATITVDNASELGSINWFDQQASSLSELIVDLGNTVGREQLDGQIATALLTGVVAETARFSNEKTTPQTMSISAELMTAGANQQLVASKLDEPTPEPEQPEETPQDDLDQDDGSGSHTDPDGTLEIEHPVDESEHDEPEEPQSEDAPAEQPADEAAAAEPEQPNEPEISDVKQNDVPEAALPTEDSIVEAPEEPLDTAGHGKLVTEPPALGGTLTANSRPDDIMLEPASDPLTNATDMPQPLLDRNDEPAVDVPNVPLDQPEPPFTPPQPAPPDWMPPQPWLNDQAAPASPSEDMPLPPVVPNSDETLSDIEESVHSPHVEATPEPAADLDSARDEVMKAINSVSDSNPAPVQALNAQPIDLNTPPVAPAFDAASSIGTAQDLPQPPVPPAPPVSTAFDPTSFDIMNDQQPETPARPDLTGPVDQPFTLPVPGAVAPQAPNPVPPTSPEDGPTPPPVPPPLYPQ